MMSLTVVLVFLQAPRCPLKHMGGEAGGMTETAPTPSVGGQGRALW